MTRRTLYLERYIDDYSGSTVEDSKRQDGAIVKSPCIPFCIGTHEPAALKKRKPWPISIESTSYLKKRIDISKHTHIQDRIQTDP
jgi:hypothetical protein